MVSALIVGSGPAAAGAALAMASRDDIEITVLDMGLELEGDHRKVLEALETTEPADWTAEGLAVITAQPIASTVHGIPEKFAYGSDFSFRDVGQLQGVSAERRVHRALISAAYGGFSNTWGAQITPFTAGALEMWPAGSRPTESSYRAVLSQIPFAGEHDDLAALLPLIATPSPLPPPSERAALVLDAYERCRHHLNRMGVTLGRARLAFESPSCVRCRLCMTGCPYSLIYSSSFTFDKLRRARRVTYHGGLMALKVGDDGSKAFVLAKEMGSGRVLRFEADRVFVACGAMGTTRLVVNSLQLFNQKVMLQESGQFILPLISKRPTSNPRTEPQFTLNQFNMVVALDDVGRDVSQLHYYTYNPAFEAALPRVLRSHYAQPVVEQLLRRLSVTFGYLPSWVSPHIYLTALPPRPGDDLPQVLLSRDRPRWDKNAMLRKVLTRVVRSSRHLDLWPLLPMITFAGGGKSYHWGGSFPHHSCPRPAFSSDELGRVGPWNRVHLVDASVFPNVAATTFTLTIMANAHRIATEALANER
jgi:ferredoxin